MHLIRAMYFSCPIYGETNCSLKKGKVSPLMRGRKIDYFRPDIQILDCQNKEGCILPRLFKINCDFLP